jgi:hypothetical protein
VKKLAFLLVLGGGALFGSPFQNGAFESPVLIGSPDFTTVPTGWVNSDPSGAVTVNQTGVAGVPEPSTMALASLGSLAMLAVRRRTTRR